MSTKLCMDQRQCTLLTFVPQVPITERCLILCSTARSSTQLMKQHSTHEAALNSWSSTQLIVLRSTKFGELSRSDTDPSAPEIIIRSDFVTCYQLRLSNETNNLLFTLSCRNKCLLADPERYNRQLFLRTAGSCHRWRAWQCCST